MYNLPVYWSDKLKCSFLQRVILIHSYLYYEANNSVITDREYDAIAKQLVTIQQKHTVQWIKNCTQYGYAFYDFDGTTGFDLWYRLNLKDRQYIQNIAERIVKQ